MPAATTNNPSGSGFALFDTAIGRCALVWRGGLVVGAALPEASDERARASLARRFPGAADAEPPPFAAEAIARIVGLLAGGKADPGDGLGRNPVPIVVPCHRVLAADGRSGGFSAPGGVATKFRILEIEGARRPGEPELFESLPLRVKPS
jgi:methylated-DNA-[protein]-cysteine S-methyltransferase